MTIRNYFIYFIVCGVLLLACSKNKADDLPEDPIVPETPALDELVAGSYSGEYSCAWFDGTSYQANVGSAHVTIESVADTVWITENTAGCIKTYYPFVKERLIFDTLDTTKLLRAEWHGFSQYDFVTYYPENDSLSVSTPEHSSQGWLGKFFRGKKD